MPKLPFRVRVRADGSWSCPGCSHHQAPPRAWLLHRLDLIEVAGARARWHARHCPDFYRVNKNPSSWADR